MRTFFKEFKEFISKGDVMSMAVGLIIGAAFTAIVNSLVADIITPLLGIIIGGINFSGIIINVGEADVMVGNFIQAIITFIITALVIFTIVRSFNKMKKKEVVEPVKEEPVTAPEVLLLEEIRDLLKRKEA